MPVEVTFVTTPPGISTDDPYLIQPDLAPGSSAGVANSAAIQAALDALPIRGTGQKATVLVPVGTWRLDRTIWGDMNDVEFVGYGQTKSILQMNPFVEGPAFAIGMPRGPAPTDNHWVDSFGVLDSTAAPTAGVRWGLDLRSDSHANFGPCGWSRALGDYWGTTSKITIELACWGPLPVGPIVGASWTLADPWIVRVHSGGSVQFSFTVDPTDTGLQGTRVTVSGPNLTTLTAGVLHRITMQFNMSNDGGPAFTVWVDGVQATTPASQSTLGIALPGTFRAHTGCPWKIGAASPIVREYLGDFYSETTLLALRLHGLRVSAGLRYVDNGLGSALTRIDAAPITDLNRYFQADSITCGYLPMDESPAACIPTRRLPMRTQFGTGFGMLVDPDQSGVYSTSGWSFRDLTVMAGTYGEAVTLGATLNVEADRCKFGGGVRGLSTWQWYVSYPIRMNECTFEGSDSPVFVYGSQAYISHADFPNTGRHLLWAAASVATMDNWFFTFGTPRSLVVGRRGATVLCRGFLADIEGANSPTIAAFLMESGNAVNGGMDSGGLTLRDFGGGSFMASKPVAKLLDGINNPAQPRPAWFYADGQFILHSVHAALAETQTATGWTGRVLIRPPWAGFVAATGPGAAGIVAL